MTVVAIDFETANEGRTSACSIGLAWIEGRDVVRSEERLLRPRDMRFLPWNTYIHGIHAEDVVDAPMLSEVWPDLAPHFADALVLAHNASFDLSVLRHTLDEAGIDWPVCRYLCTVTISRLVWPDLSSHRLNALAQHLGIPLDHHHAGSDAVACARIAIAAAEVAGVDGVEALPQALKLTPGALTPGGYTPARGGGRRQRRRSALATAPIAADD